MTSREVAAILSTAGPMAPPSDDDYDDNSTNLDDDDVSELEEQRQRRLSSAMQLLRISSDSSTSPSNTSTGTSVAPATPPRHRDMQLTPYRSQYNPAQLNNGRSGRRVDEFRSKVNGVCDVAADRRNELDRCEVNGGRWAGVGSVPASCRQHLSLFDLLLTHRLLSSTLQVRLKNGHQIGGPPFQVSSRRVIK